MDTAKMDIVEKFVMGKQKTGFPCEDGIIDTKHFVGVVDGSTGKTSVTWDGDSPGLRARNLCRETFLDLRADISAFDAVKRCSRAIMDLYRGKNCVEYMKNNPWQRPTASFAVYSRYKNEIWFVGDCQARVSGEVITNNKEIDQILSQTREIWIRAQMMEGVSEQKLLENSSGREFIYPLLRKQSYFQNQSSDEPYSYGVIDGFPVPEEHVKIYTIEAAEEPFEIVLGTDGYPRLYPTLEESEDYLKKIIKNDPLCIDRYRTTKGVYKGNESFDDRAYIRASIGGGST